MGLFDFFKTATPEPQETAVAEIDYNHAPDDGVTVRYLKDMGQAMATASVGYSSFGFDGEKFAGGMNDGNALYDSVLDYDVLQRRSAKLFRENPYARGLIRRLITNEITTGLHPEVVPEESVIGVPEDSLADWSEDIEIRFHLWSKSKQLCDYSWQSTFSKIQRIARMEAIISGDVLVVLHSVNGQPSIELVRGERIRTPLMTKNVDLSNKTIIDGIEFDKRGRHVAYWILQDDGNSSRVASFGAGSKRRTAWIIYGTEKRLGDHRGEPLLSLVIQSLSDIDRYKDSAQRKALINSLLAIFIKKDEDKPGTKPLSNGATRKTSGTVTDATGAARKFNMADQLPGMAIETLQHGETPVAFGNDGTDVNFGEFEASILRGVAWAFEIPPEILQLSFNSNYSASQAAINEFNIYLNRTRAEFAEDFCQPIYVDWLLSQVIIGKVKNMEILQSFKDPNGFDIFAAWTSSDWAGAIKPSTDMKKMGQAYKIYLDEGLITYDRASKEVTGMKFSKIMQKRKKENELIAAAARPLLELAAEFGQEETDKVIGATATTEITAIDEINDRLEPIEEVTENG